MTNLAGSAELRSSVIWVSSLVIVCGMASEACFWGSAVITFVTGGTIVGDRDMRPCQDIVRIMCRERSRLPTGSGCMAGCTFIRNTNSLMIRVC